MFIKNFIKTIKEKITGRISYSVTVNTENEGNVISQHQYLLLVEPKTTNIIMVVSKMEFLSEGKMILSSYNSYVLPQEVAQTISTLLFKITHGQTEE